MTRTHMPFIAVVFAVTILTACSQSTPTTGGTPAATAASQPTSAAPANPSTQSPAPSPSTSGAASTSAESDSPFAQLKDLVDALGLKDHGSEDGSTPPDGLASGGDCPPAPAGADEEMAAQANAAVPLKEGLTLASLWRPNPDAEYECLLQITKIMAKDIVTTMSCTRPGGKTWTRRVCRSDLRHARLLHTQYGTFTVIDASGAQEPELITGATAFSLSSDLFGLIKNGEQLPYHYVQYARAERLDINDSGELRVEGRATASVIVNDKPVDLPVIKLSGKIKSWNRGQSSINDGTALVLDDERFPLLVDVRSRNDKGEFRVQYGKITYPSEERGGALENGLLENNRVDVYGIYFDFNSDRIRPESEPVLKEIEGVMKRHPDWRLSIAGHTDNVGGNGDYNLQLSRKRSEAVRNALVTRFGIAGDRLTSNGFGAGSPKDTNDTPEGRARNRRVELVRQ